MFAGRSCRNCRVFDIQRGVHKYPGQKWKNRYFIILLKCCCLVPWLARFYLFSIEKRKPLEPDLILWIIGSRGCFEPCRGNSHMKRLEVLVVSLGADFMVT